MRISPTLTRGLRHALFAEARRNPNHPVVFLFHPNECLDYNPPREDSSMSGALLADRFRTSLKLRNLGLSASRLAEELLAAAEAAGFEFTTASRFRTEFMRGA